LEDIDINGRIISKYVLIHLAQDKYQCQVLVSKVINLWIPKRR
jgi:hypothetical protein